MGTEKQRTVQGTASGKRGFGKKYNKSQIKREIVVLADEAIETARFNSTENAAHKHGWLDNNGKNQWDSWNVVMQEKNKAVYTAVLKIANATDGKKYLYEINNIKMVEQGRNFPKTSTNSKIPQTNENVNTAYEQSGAKSMAGLIS